MTTSAKPCASSSLSSSTCIGITTVHIPAPITETGVYRLSDGKNNALAPVGAPNPRESFDVVTTPEKLDAEVEKVQKVVTAVMEKASLPSVSLSVPLTVDARAAQNWDAAH